MVNQAIYELGIAPQTAKGAAAAVAMFKTRVTGGDVAPARNIVDLMETGRNRLNRQAIVGSFGADGNPSVALRPDVAALLLFGALGSIATTGAAEPWEHESEPANALPYFTLWRMVGDLIYERFVDCKIGQLDLVSEAGDSPWLTATATWVGRTSERLDLAAYTTAVGATPYSDARPLVHYDGSGLFLLEGTAIAEMERIALTIANGAARQPGDSLGADDVSEGRQRITVATRQRVKTAMKNLYDRLHYGTSSPTSGAGPNPNVLELGAGGLDFKWVSQAAPEHSLRIQASRVQVKSIAGFTPGTGDDPLRGETTYEIYDATPSPFTSTVSNGIDDYTAV